MDWSDRVKLFQHHSMHRNATPSNVWILSEDPGRRYSKRSAFGHCVFIADQIPVNSNNRNIFGGERGADSFHSIAAAQSASQTDEVARAVNQSSARTQDRWRGRSTNSHQINTPLSLDESSQELLYSQPSDANDELVSPFGRLSLDDLPSNGASNSNIAGSTSSVQPTVENSEPSIDETTENLISAEAAAHGFDLNEEEGFMEYYEFLQNMLAHVHQVRFQSQ